MIYWGKVINCIDVLPNLYKSLQILLCIIWMHKHTYNLAFLFLKQNNQFAKFHLNNKPIKSCTESVFSLIISLNWNPSSESAS